MKTLIKIAVLLLALLMIVPCLAACNPKTPATKKPDNNPVVEDPYLKVVDMKRYNYKAFVRSNVSGNGAFYCEDFWVDEETGGADALSYAVIARNNEIESTYNCTITQEWSTMESMYEEMRSIFEGQKTYELTIMVATDAAKCASTGYLSNLKNDFNSEYINLDHKSFDQNTVMQMTLGENLYYISGDMNISSLDNTIATILNVNEYEAISESLVNTFNDADFVSAYTLVEEGKWTVENMLKIAREYTLDADESDGFALSHEYDDYIGYFEYQAAPLYYYYGAGMRITENTDGYPVFTYTETEASEVYDALFDALNTVKNTDIPHGASAVRGPNFQSNQCLFADYILWDVRRVLYSANIAFAYGIVPVPTLEEDAEFHSVVYFQNCAHLWALPYRRSHAEYAARMMYIMTVYSGMPDSTLDAYYIRTMYMEVAKDDGSRASLEIIRYSLVYDIALLYEETWGEATKMIKGISTNTDRNYATYTDPTRMESVTNKMNETIDAFFEFGRD